VDSLEDWLTIYDKTVYAFLLSKAQEKNIQNEFVESYLRLYHLTNQIQEALELANTLIEKLEFVYEKTPYSTIIDNLKAIKPLEQDLKNIIKGWLEFNKEPLEIDEDYKKHLDNFISNDDLVYFEEKEYNNENLNILMTILRHFYVFCYEVRKATVEELLEFQQEFL
jgi:nitrate/nitrite-specific signal transduction histidine kinase